MTTTQLGRARQCAQERRHLTLGFTLIELMIVILIIGVLSAVAVPTYQENVNKSRRSEAASALSEGAQKLERYYSTHGSYLDGTGNLAAVFQVQIPSTGTSYYTLAVGAAGATATTFNLQATATGLMANDKCGSFAISQSGEHTLVGAHAGSAVTDCWRR